MKAKLPQALRLSIGMIVKNGGETFEKSLQSLEHLRNTVPSELIIVDTGSTDGSIETAKRYTDQVYQFEWCDDFAAARNASLDYASGEWFLFLDADEWFEDTSNLEAFLMSAQRNQYMNAAYFQRNYGNMEGTDYTDFLTSRVFRRMPGRRFQGRVHEYVIALNEPKILHDYVHHYGYVVEDPDGVSDRPNRNVPLLKTMLEENPDFPHTYFQLMREYWILKDRDQSLEYGHRGLELIKQQRKPLGILCAFYRDLSAINFAIDRYEEAVRLGKEYFEERPHPFVTDIDVASIVADSLRILKRNEEALEYYDRTIELFGMEDAGALDERDRVSSVVVCDNPGFREKVFGGRAISLMELERYDEALEQFSSIDLAKTKEYTPLIRLECTCVREGGDPAYLAERYRKVAACGDKDILHILQNNLNTMAREDPDAGGRVVSYFMDCGDLQDDYIKLLRLRHLRNQGEKDIPLLQELMDSADASRMEIGELLYFALAWGVELTAFVRTMESERAGEYISAASALHPDFTETAIDAILGACPETMEELYWLCCVGERLLLEKKDHPPLGLPMVFESYCRFLSTYVLNLYRPEMLQEEACGLLARSHRFGYYAGQAYALKEQGDISGYLRLLTKAGEAYPVMLPFVKQVLSETQEKLYAEEQRESEREMVARQIKDAILDMIGQGAIEDAEQALHGYAQVNPDDEEILSIRLQMRMVGYRS